MGHKRTSGADEGDRADRAQEIGLFRYALIRPVADPALTTRQRGPLVRELAEQEHLGPFGDRVRVSRVTLDRWIRAWTGGRLRRPGSLDPARRAPHGGVGAGAGGGVEAGGPRTDRRPGRGDPGRACGLGALGADPATALRPPGAQHPPRRDAAEGVRPVRGRRPQRPVDRGRAAWPGRRRPQDVPVRVHRRPLPGPDGLPVGPQRGHGPARGRTAPWHRLPAGSHAWSIWTTARP